MRCCRCRCVVKEEDDETVGCSIEKKPFNKTKQRGGGFCLTPSKNSKFLQDFGVCCVCDFGVLLRRFFENGHLECLQYAHEKGCPDDE